MIKRHILNQLQKTLKIFPAVAILGPRQAGKTTIAKELAKTLSRNVIYLDLENPDDHFLLQNPLAFLRENKTSCIIIDEVQRMTSLFPVLRSVIDEYRKPGRFIITGSASPDLLLNSAY